MNKTKTLLLLVVFIDYIGVGLIYPMFSSMLFDPEYPLIKASTSNGLRGFYLGALLAAMPLMQFFSAPFWGAISDIKGRKSPLIQSLVLALLGYVVAFGGALFASLPLLFLSRALIGFAAGNTSIIQASISDISDETSRTRNFGLYSMALGSGFTLGPLIGGTLSRFGYETPFLFASLVIIFNLFFAKIFFKDTFSGSDNKTFEFSLGLSGIKESLVHKTLRGTFIASFVHNFGWCYFFEFIPVFLFGIMNFNREKLGVFYAIAGLFYALSAGILIRPFVKKYKPLTLFRLGLISSGIVIIAMGFATRDLHLWIALFALCFCVAFVTPSSTSYVSSHCSKNHEGKILGSLSAMNSIALILAPIASGSLVGNYPKMPVFFGGSVIIIACLISLGFQIKDQKTL